MTPLDDYLQQVTDQLRQALDYLEYSYRKVQKLPTDPKQLSQETLETWESFAARFARVADIFLMKYLKARIKEEDPGFRGSLRDFLNESEKLGLIDNVEVWLQIRSLRNIAAHEYNDTSLQSFLSQLREQSQHLLAIKSLFSL